MGIITQWEESPVSKHMWRIRSNNYCPVHTRGRLLPLLKIMFYGRQVKTKTNNESYKGPSTKTVGKHTSLVLNWQSRGEGSNPSSCFTSTLSEQGFENDKCPIPEVKQSKIGSQGRLSTLISQGYENEGASILQLTLLLLSAEDSGGKLIIVY